MDDAGVFLTWLLGRPQGPVENHGATSAFAAFSGCEISAVMRSRRVRRLTAREKYLLQALGATTGHERRGVLYAGPVPAAATTAIVLPHRIPAEVRRVLGIAESGAVLPADAEVPLGRALRGFGVRREVLDLQMTPGTRDAAGNELAIYSAARLWLGAPIALVTERVYRRFLAAFPRS
jgi:hypothetical protein